MKLKSCLTPLSSSFSFLSSFLIFLLTLVGNQVALAETHGFLDFSAPTGGGSVTVVIGVPTITIHNITVQGGVKGKRDAILEILQKDNHAKNFSPVAVGNSQIQFNAGDAGTKITFHSGTTGEAIDELKLSKASFSEFGFDNLAFNPNDAFGNPSQFTGGIMTDIGELAFTVSASDLPSLDGTTITQALFSLLEPLSSGYGASITNGGDFLAFTFDSTKTISGGVIFGTTSLSSGVYGSVTTVPEASTYAMILAGLGLVCGMAAWRHKQIG